MDKREIRRKISMMRKMLSEQEKNQAALEVFARLENSVAFMMSDKILMYHSLPDELPTVLFLDKWNSKKKFYLPRVNGADLDILPYDKSRLELGSFHIEEPIGDDIVDEAEIELIIVPAVAYDRDGNRLGRGKGFYDRLLKRAKAYKIGICYDFQIVENLPVEMHDIPVDMVISQSETIIMSLDKNKNKNI